MSDFLKLKKEVSETTADIEPDDVLSVKNKLKGFGYYKEPEYGMTKFGDSQMFEGIRKFQTGNKLKVDGVMKPEGETENKVNQIIQNPLKEIRKSILDIYETNEQIKELARNKPYGYDYNDKNAHALMSCNISQHGKLSRAVIGLAGAVRESIQQRTGANTKPESIEDMKANIWGWKKGFENPNADCQKLIEEMYPRYIKRR